MLCDLLDIVNNSIAGLQPYHPGKPVEELRRELGLSHIIKLASNENALGPSPKVLEKIIKTKDISRYPDGNGFNLKKALADKHNVKPEQITLGNGSNDVLEMVARVFINPGDQVVYSQHSFAVYSLVSQAVGAKHIVVPAINWGHDLLAMLDAVTDTSRLMFIANPNNPTGTWLARDNLRYLLENIPEHVIVLVDEAYFEFAQFEMSYPDVSLWLSDFKNLIVTRTFSKAYGLAGLRIGYALSHPDIANLLNRVRQPFNNNILALVSAETALSDKAHIEKSVDVNTKGMKQLMFAFDNMKLAFIPSIGNFICVDFEQSADHIYQELLKMGIIVRPIANYGMPNYLRISIGLEPENTQLISALNEILSR